MFTEPMLVAVLFALAVGAFWMVVPRCPECQSLLSARDSMDPGLRHCRRCLAVFRPRERP